ncbi:hypothetical protein TNCV_4573721 [Trichonephila clavipes]|nr:hypothetical protein TNCV_4573721 [Trichonephila clavipes]
MAPLVSRRPGSVFMCYARIGLGRLLWPANEKGRGAWCGPALVFKKDFFRRREESPGWRVLEKSPEKKETWTVEDRDWSGKKGETINAAVVGELE